MAQCDQQIFKISAIKEQQNKNEKMFDLIDLVDNPTSLSYCLYDCFQGPIRFEWKKRINGKGGGRGIGRVHEKKRKKVNQ